MSASPAATAHATAVHAARVQNPGDPRTAGRARRNTATAARTNGAGIEMPMATAPPNASAIQRPRDAGCSSTRSAAANRAP